MTIPFTLADHDDGIIDPETVHRLVTGTQPAASPPLIVTRSEQTAAARIMLADGVPPHAILKRLRMGTRRWGNITADLQDAR